jgi:hypothetical protein
LTARRRERSLQLFPACATPYSGELQFQKIIRFFKHVFRVALRPQSIYLIVFFLLGMRNSGGGEADHERHVL